MREQYAAEQRNRLVGLADEDAADEEEASIDSQRTVTESENPPLFYKEYMLE